MEIVQLPGGQLIITGTATELEAIQELLAEAADADSEDKALDAVWRYQERLEEQQATALPPPLPA